jgi:uncharacterized membrane protein YfcA
MIIYIAVFSPLNAYFATRFYSDNKNIKIQSMGFFLLLLGFILGVLVYMIIPNINFLLILILFFIVILLRIFYSSIFWKRYKSKRIEKNPKI